MSHYRSARRSNSSTAGPVVVFLLIACFGLLFVTGCSSNATSGENTEDDTFTAEDVARFEQMAAQNTSSGDTMAMSSAMSVPPTVLTTATGSEASSVTTDPALRKRYDVLRAMSSGDGSNTYRVTNTFLNVRATPNVTGEFVVRLNQGEIVRLVEFTNASWAKISLPDGKTGYVAAQYISKLTTEERLKDEQKAFEGLYFVNFAFVNVRAGADTNSDKLGEIPGQAFVRPLSMEKDWARVAFEGKQGYVSTQFLSPFRPAMLVRQDRYQLPILHYTIDQDSALTTLTQHITALKNAGIKFITLRTLFDTVQTQEVRDARLPPKSVVIAISGVTAQNAKKISDVLGNAGVTATLFVQTDQVGISGISEKLLLTLQANGLDIQSAGHTGDDLRTLTNDQTKLELNQSRVLLEQMTHKTVFAVAYPQGGANDRVLSAAADAGYLFGIGSAPDTAFTRDQFLRLPSYTITSGMSEQDVLNLTK
jgi:uncharacterized protein YgiM (DUF1202 family)